MAAHCSGCARPWCVCAHFGWVKCREQIPSMGNHTWPYVTSLSRFHFQFWNRINKTFLFIIYSLHYKQKMTAEVQPLVQQAKFTVNMKNSTKEVTIMVKHGYKKKKVMSVNLKSFRLLKRVQKIHYCSKMWAFYFIESRLHLFFSNIKNVKLLQFKITVFYLIYFKILFLWWQS